MPPDVCVEWKYTKIPNINGDIIMSRILIDYQSITGVNNFQDHTSKIVAQYPYMVMDGGKLDDCGN